MPKSNEATIVVVDDEPAIRDLLATSLKFSGFAVEMAATGSQAIETIEKIKPDLIVLDVMLPDIDGFTVTRRIRQEGINAPILFLTARDDSQDKIMGLSVGGDDYVTKPFSLEEVVARIRAILRRTKEDETETPVIRVADLEINTDSHDVTRGGQLIDLSPTQYKLLRYLMENERPCSFQIANSKPRLGIRLGRGRGNCRNIYFVFEKENRRHKNNRIRREETQCGTAYSD